MGEVELQPQNNLLIIHSTIYFYGHAANEILSFQIAKDIADHWNEPNGTAIIKRNHYKVLFKIEGVYEKLLQPEIIFENTHPGNNSGRICSWKYFFC